jgi:hypothetical protein
LLNTKALHDHFIATTRIGWLSRLVAGKDSGGSNTSQGLGQPARLLQRRAPYGA